MKTNFADTFYFVALLDRRDAHHQRVAEFSAGYHGHVLTTRWVLAETANALADSDVREQAAQLIQKIDRLPGFRILGESDDLFERGVELYAARPDKEWSLTDCISFVVMREQELREALTGDHHFAQAGFVPLFAA